MSRAVTLANFASGEALTLDETNDRVGIASTTPDATLDIKNTILIDGDAGIVTATSFVSNSTTKAFYPPILTTTQRDAMTVTEGAVVFNTTTNKLNFYNGSGWEAVTSS